MADLALAIAVVVIAVLMDWVVWGEACIGASYLVGAEDWYVPQKHWLRYPEVVWRAPFLCAAAAWFAITGANGGGSFGWLMAGVAIMAAYFLVAGWGYYRILRDFHGRGGG